MKGWEKYLGSKERVSFPSAHKKITSDHVKQCNQYRLGTILIKGFKLSNWHFEFLQGSLSFYRAFCNALQVVETLLVNCKTYIPKEWFIHIDLVGWWEGTALSSPHRALAVIRILSLGHEEILDVNSYFSLRPAFVLFILVLFWNI